MPELPPTAPHLHPQAAAINAQQLARSPEGLPLLLSLLEPEPAGLSDFYARYHTLQVLKGLVAAAPLALQQVGSGGVGYVSLRGRWRL